LGVRQDRIWIGHLLVNAASGAALGVLLATAFVAADLTGLGSLMERSIGLLPGLALLATLFGVAFAFMSAATAVMMVRPSPEPGGQGRLPAFALVPVRVRPSSRR
jgi:hypothetical protein